MYVLKVRVGLESKFICHLSQAFVVVSDSIADAICFPSRSSARIYAGLIEELCLNLDFSHLVILPVSVDDEAFVDSDSWFKSDFIIL